MKAEQILEKYAQKNMIQWNQKSFKQTHSRLHRSIIESINEALNIPVIVGQSKQLCEELHNTDFMGKCFKCGEQVFIKEDRKLWEEALAIIDDNLGVDEDLIITNIFTTSSKIVEFSQAQSTKKEEFLINTLKLIIKESNEDYAVVVAKNTLQEINNN